MAWRFEPGENLQDAFRRVASEEIGKVRAGLVTVEDDHAQAIHAARQGFKRLRALARLARHALGADFTAENRCWRDAGKLLSGSRDRTVLMETFEMAVAGCDGLPAEAIARLRNHLQSNGTAPHPSDAEGHIAEVLVFLDGAEERIATLSWPASGEALQRGLKDSQERLRKSWKKAVKVSSSEALHHWRKRVKDQAAQLRLFRRVLPDAFRTLRAVAKVTAENLGEEHDLWILSEHLRGQALPPEAASARDMLLEAIEKRSAVLRESAFDLGEGFSSRDAKAFARALCQAWERGTARARKARRKKARSSASAAATSTSQGR